MHSSTCRISSNMQKLYRVSSCSVCSGNRIYGYYNTICPSWNTFINNTNINTNNINYFKNNYNINNNYYSTTTNTYKKPCPFTILKIPKDTTYANAKKTFLKIAMKNHPDTLTNLLKDLSEMEKKQTLEKASDRFRKAREAFESLVELDDGLCALKADLKAIEEATMSDDAFDAWFKHETGHSNPYQFDLDPKTMREVVTATETIGGGLDRDGGMWTLANMVANSVKSGKSAASVLRIQAGEIIEENEDKSTRVRRRRRGEKW